MDKAITTVLLTIAGLVAVLAIFNPIYAAVNRGSGALVSSAQTVNERVKTLVRIVQSIGELNSAGSWVDVAEPDGDFDVVVWVKNVGAQRITALDTMDVFFGQPGDYKRIPYIDDAGGLKPWWTFSIVNGTEWLPAATVKVVIHFSSAKSAGTYQVNIVTPSGVADEMEFSM